MDDKKNACVTFSCALRHPGPRALPPLNHLPTNAVPWISIADCCGQQDLRAFKSLCPPSVSLLGLELDALKGCDYTTIVRT